MTATVLKLHAWRSSRLSDKKDTLIGANNVSAAYRSIRKQSLHLWILGFILN